MANYNRDNQSGERRGFGGKPRFNNNRPDRPELFKATCASCGNACEVPFRPTGSKPVLCRDCFRNNPMEDNRRAETRGGFNRPSTEDRQMFDAVCSNCGDKCQIPFRPSQGRDVFCSRCFDMNKGGDTRDARRPERPDRAPHDRPVFNRDENRPRPEGPNYKAQFEALNAKMDRILELLNPTPMVAEPLESIIDEKVLDEIVEEVIEAKPASKAAAKEKKPKKEKAAVKKTTIKKKAVASKEK